jgi:hypothetical protein
MTERYPTKAIRVTLPGQPPFIAENLVGLSVAAAHYPDAIALEVVDALPTEAPGEMMEVRFNVWRNRYNQEIEWVDDAEDDLTDNLQIWEHIATITARVPLPRVPEIVATVEPAP